MFIGSVAGKCRFSELCSTMRLLFLFVHTCPPDQYLRTLAPR
jgi:hypothetical protein